ncbi:MULTISPECIES: S8 family serine peptidase [Bradyrhizobium]|uniref:Subtilase family protein n=1 Tax=Bradyrhizobium yuanmingense TaxID=108015 RepID=A0A1C3TXL1_9BRAD|nr:MULTISPECIES: S8 family serine peptidase [Bradyrhizobium]MCA1381835.1 S8 family serine peptidase [Bradyrhizobium sp. BRP05]MCA1417400.1 S8 family serine peptidase [Bradyrhizobium sp. BRP23]MCA1424675.1 S8 family serine peptidase [Bradyrhizobium sp. NBAIM16]MCA1509374.1 S8 family serine peptidase [Bradyrhizobium sp. NBAIM01]TWI30679.1 subtilase family protein [Bradyrhizobium yuanmingense]
MTGKSESRVRTGARASSVGVALLVAFCFGVELAQAQAIMRTPTISVPSRTPTVSPNITPRVSPNIAARAVSVGRGPRTMASIPTTSRIRPTTPVLPHARYSPNLYPACTAAYRSADGECLAQPNAGGEGTGKSGKKSAGKGRGNNTPVVLTSRSFAGEFVAEIDGALSTAEADELARRHGLTRLASENFPLIGATFGLFRIADGRPYETVRREFAADGSVRSLQPNFRYVLQDQKSSAATEGDPAQYALAKLRLPQAHTLAHGANVTIAVIDSGIDARHPELANSIADNFDALGSAEGPHVHGTGIAGAIAAHARLMGSAPEARIIAIRAFGGANGGAESSSYIILRSLNYAAEHGAQIVNMSFAGPKDAVIERAIAATAARGLILIAAAGNAGAKSPPLYPAANPNVIAVSATDRQDRLFSASNRGNYIAVAAPGVDIFLPAPDGKYQVTSGTSFSAAYVSGVAALLLERNHTLKPEALRMTLVKTARDLGSPGRDDLFGDGQADAFAAVMAVPADSATPVAAAPGTTKREDAPKRREEPGARAIEQTSLSSAEDKSAVSQADRPPAR